MQTQTIQKANNYAQKALKGHKRLSNSYYEHSLEVYNKLLEIGMNNEALLVAALLHEIPKTHPDLQTELKETFGSEVTRLLQNFTNTTGRKIELHTPKETGSVHYMQTFINLAQDLRVIILRLADKVVDIKTVHLLPVEKRFNTAEKAIEIYSPICKLLGLKECVRELEDNAFKILNPREYLRINKYIDENLGEINKFLDSRILLLYEIFGDEGIHADITSRVKNAYGIYKKHLRYQKDTAQNRRSISSFEQLHDIIGIRILVNDQQECYIVEDILKQLWEPVSRLRSDYIQNPRPSGYKSIHNVFKARCGFLLQTQNRMSDLVGKLT